MTTTKTTTAAKGAAKEKTAPAPAAAKEPAGAKEKATPAPAPVAANAPSAAKEPASAKAKTDPAAEAVAQLMQFPAAVFPGGEGTDLFKGYAQIAELGTENVRAVIAAGTVLAKGFEVLGKEVADYARDSLTAGVAAAKQIAESKTLEEALDRQSAYAKTSFDRLVAETAKLSEISATVAKDSFQPLSTHIDAATDRLVKTIAA